MHHPFTQPARGNQKRRSRPEFQNTTRSRRTQKTPAKPPPKPKTFHTQPTKRPRCNLAHTPNSRQQKPQPPTERTPNRPAPRRSRPCTSKEKWNLQKSHPNFLIGSKTIFDQKFFDLDLLSTKKQTKMTTRSAHQRSTILVLNLFLQKLQRRLTSTRLQTPLQGNKTLQCDMQ
jgi:hypothetical protein